MKIRDIKLSTKSVVIILFVVLCFASVIGWISVKMSGALSDTRYATARAATEIGKGVLEYYAREAKEGRLTLEEAQNGAKEAVKSIRYEGAEYFWINDTTLPYPTMIMHSTNPALDGQVLDNPSYNVAMGKNQNLFQAFVEVCKRDGGGFVDYVWSKPGEPDHLRFPKISYVMLFPEWNWIIGTGVYIDNVKAMLKEVFVPIIVFSALAILMIIIALVFLVRSILKSIKMLMALVNRLAEGDFTERIQIDQKDEIGVLVTTLNGSTDNLEKLISEVMVSTQNLAQAVEQISSGNQNLSQRTSEQASSLEEIASTIEEATATINQNAENANRARELTDTGAVKSVEGNRVALEAVESIKDMNESSKKVADIITVINEIAFQTNLLALNAAVEAARAGEQGRGFAVVAGEVRNLAQRSGNAAKEIETLIKDTVGKVDRGTDLVSKTGESLSEIAEAAKTTAQIISEIAAASLEQKQGINQINNAIMEMDTMTQQNASLVEETASASEEMANQAQDLLDMVQRFRIRESVERDYTREFVSRSQPARSAPTRSGRDMKKPASASKSGTAHGGIKDIMKQDGFEEF